MYETEIEWELSGDRSTKCLCVLRLKMFIPLTGGPSKSYTWSNQHYYYYTSYQLLVNVIQNKSTRHYSFEMFIYTLKSLHDNNNIDEKILTAHFSFVSNMFIQYLLQFSICSIVFLKIFTIYFIKWKSKLDENDMKCLLKLT